jgi:hypothetical protein
MGNKKCMQYFGWKPEGKNHSEDPGLDEKIILEWILEKQVGRMWTGCIWFRIGTSGGLL